MKKEIYIIRNDLNNKVYIGQAIDSKMRFQRHKSNGKHHPGTSLIDDKIFNFGEEHFWYEVLETSENYNEREKYWIKFYNCITPNGYNQTAGGSGLDGGIYNMNASIKDEQVLKNIIDDICNSSLKLIEIANKYQLSLKIISSINRGNAYFNEELSYPLRKRYNDDIKAEINDLIAYDLKFTNKTYRILAKEYLVSTFYIGEINAGTRENTIIKDFPIRKKNNEEINEIRMMLIMSDDSFRSIAKQLQVSYSKVQSINSGRYHFDNKFQYPLREYKQYNIGLYS